MKHVAKGKVTYKTWQMEGLLMKHVAKGMFTYETCGKGKDCTYETCVKGR